MFGVTRTINGETKEHKGIDIANAEGTPIYASAAGTVTVSGPAGGYGNLIRIAHAGGMDTLYGHARKLLVAKGDKVTQGQLIAEMGNLGKSTGPHLHFEVVEGGTVKDPTEYLAGFPKQQLAKVEYAAPVVVVAPTAQMGYITYKGKQVAYRQS
jgi:murein DD-endopeptidase MepM/ murein hydrolase activator NlpD